MEIKKTYEIYLVILSDILTDYLCSETFFIHIIEFKFNKSNTASPLDGYSLAYIIIICVIFLIVTFTIRRI